MIGTFVLWSRVEQVTTPESEGNTRAQRTGGKAKNSAPFYVASGKTRERLEVRSVQLARANP